MTSSQSTKQVEEFIETIKKPQKLIEGCRLFHETEPRDIAYVVCHRIISEAPQDTSHIIAAGRIFLQLWNAVYYQRLPRNLKQSMEDDILKAYRACEDELTMHRQEQLQSIDLQAETNSAAIRKAFRSFAQYRSIADTGASKLLHLINPHLFMMWDTAIRDAYKPLYLPYVVASTSQNHLDFICECYLQFMGTCQHIAKAILERIEYAQLWSQHLSMFKDTKFVEAWTFSETVAKMIDECNFVRWRMGITF